MDAESYRHYDTKSGTISFQNRPKDSHEEDIMEFLQDRLEQLESTKNDVEEATSDSVSEIRKNIAARLETHLKALGYSKGDNGLLQDNEPTKSDLRAIQSTKRLEILQRNVAFLKKSALDLLENVADGDEVDPASISPELVEVRSGTIESDLFRFLTFYWSVPVSQGYGRRMRFLVRDTQNQKIIGLFALGDPVFNLRVRDKWIGWNVEQRRKNLRSVLDAFVLGAIPPYSHLLGGKLVCSLIASKEIRRAYRKKYKNTTSVISKRRHDNDLLLLTTTSALGKSSLYDRVKLSGRLIFLPVGVTKGYGHFHISQDLFLEMKRLLELLDHPYARGNRFGNGPNWRMRVIRQALQECNLDSNILKHSIQRETFMIPLASNTRKCLREENKRPKFYQSDVASLSEASLERWVIPRSERRPEFKEYKRWQFLKAIIEAMGSFDDDPKRRRYDQASSADQPSHRKGT